MQWDSFCFHLCHKRKKLSEQNDDETQIPEKHKWEEYLGQIAKDEKIVEKMCHAPADTFKINKRGYIRKGYYADLVLIDLDNEWKVNKSNLLYKCKWSPFEGKKLKSKITHTFVNGKLVYENGTFYEDIKGKRLLFNRS